MVRNNLGQLLAKNTQKFYFENIDEMKQFILKNKSNWVIEIVAMHNKPCSCFVANLFELQGKTKIQQPPSYQLKNADINLEPLFFTNLEQLKIFQKLSEKAIKQFDQAKIALIREELPDFFKNINIVY
jgi:hypothetical protein